MRNQFLLHPLRQDFTPVIHFDVNIGGGGCIGIVSGFPIRLADADSLKSFLFGAVENLQRRV